MHKDGQAMAPDDPRPSPDAGSRHGERVALAAALCNARGVQVTYLRRQILELLWEMDRPAGAYALLQVLEQKMSRYSGPATVYRSLDFLAAQGFVSRIKSRNAYVPVVNPEKQPCCAFLICSSCGSTAQFEDPRIECLLSEDARALGYRMKRRVIEVDGTCLRCVGDGAAARSRAAAVEMVAEGGDR